MTYDKEALAQRQTEQIGNGKLVGHQFSYQLKMFE